MRTRVTITGKFCNVNPIVNNLKGFSIIETKPTTLNFGTRHPIVTVNLEYCGGEIAPDILDFMRKRCA